MKNYLLLALLSLCATSNTHCAESAGAREERLEREQLSLALQEEIHPEQAHQDFLAGAAALNINPEIIDIGKELDDVQHLIDTLNPKAGLLFLDKPAKTKVDAAISYLEDTDCFSITVKQQKRVARLLGLLKEKKAIIEESEETPLFEQIGKVSKANLTAKEKNKVKGIANLQDQYTLLTRILADTCISKNAKFLYEVPNLCPKHGFQDAPSKLKAIKKRYSDKVCFPGLKLIGDDIKPHAQLITKEGFERWKNEEGPDKDLREGIFNMLEKSKIFEQKDYRKTDRYRYFVENLYIIYRNEWTCECECLKK